MISTKKEFTVWKVDKKVRPCFGTIETGGKAVKYRCQVSEEGTKIQERVIAILETLKGAKIPLNINGAMTYSNHRWMNSQVGFHIKYAMPPDMYLEKFWPTYYEEIRSELKNPEEKPDEGELKKSFDVDYYGNYLRLLRGYSDADVEPMHGDFCIRAKNPLLINTGPVVLWKRETLTCADLKDEYLRDFEKAIVATFGRKLTGTTDNLEDFGFSVCIFVTEHNESPSKAKICIGAKIDETRFIETIGPPEEIKKSFLAEHEYEKKKTKYQCKWVDKKKESQFTFSRRKD